MCIVLPNKRSIKGHCSPTNHDKVNHFQSENQEKNELMPKPAVHKYNILPPSSVNIFLLTLHVGQIFMKAWQHALFAPNYLDTSRVKRSLYKKITEAISQILFKV